VIGGPVTSMDCLLTSQMDFEVRNLTNGPACRDLVCRTDFPPGLASVVYVRLGSGFLTPMRATSCGQMEELDTFQASASYGCSDAVGAVIVH
jgi:hypothetical protein